MPDDGAAVPAGLNRILADCFVLRAGLQPATWRLHRGDGAEIERLLQDLIVFLDEMARSTAVRIRVLGGKPPGGFDELIRLASCRRPEVGTGSSPAEALSLEVMAVVRDVHTMAQIARASGDEATAHLLFGRVGFLEEATWRLGALAAADRRPTSCSGP